MKLIEEILPPVEWDFRGVREEELDSAITYEYLRSSRHVDRILDYVNQRAEYDFSNVSIFAEQYSAFPAPWIDLPDSMKRAHTITSLSVEPLRPVIEERARYSKRPYFSNGEFYLRIPSGMGTNEAVSQFREWLKANPEVAKKKRGPSSQWPRLKQLAALRLVRAGLPVELQNETAINEYGKRHRREQGSVLPQYTNGSWVNAVRDAEAYLREVEERFV